MDFRVFTHIKSPHWFNIWLGTGTPTCMPNTSHPWTSIQKQIPTHGYIGILKKCGPAEGASPYFKVAKKDSKIRQISDLSSLKK